MKRVLSKLTMTLAVVSLLAGCQEELVNRAGARTSAVCTDCCEDCPPPEPEPEPEPPQPTPQPQPTPVPPPACAGRPDLIIASVTSDSRVPGGYTVTITNVGSAATNISFNRTFFQGWVSNNGVTKLAPAGGSTFYGTMRPNESLSASIGHPNLSSYNYLIVGLTVENPALLNECSTANNSIVVPLPLP